MNNIAQLKKLYDSKIRSAQAVTFTEDALNKAKVEAYANGFQDGKNEADLEKTQRQKLFQKELMYNLQLAVDQCLKEQQAIQKNLSNLILNLSIILFKKTFPVYAKKTGEEEIIKFIEVQLNQLQKLPELIITVNPQNLKKIRAACKRLISQNNLKIQIHIKQSEKLELSDCKINWETGYIEKKLKNILDNLSSVTFELNNEPITE